MKVYIFSVLLFITLKITYSQDIIVLDVFGNVSLNDRKLEEYDRLTSEDKLILGNSNDYIMALSVSSGKVFRIPEKNNVVVNQYTQFVILVKDYIFPEDAVTGSKGDTDLDDEFGNVYYVIKESKVVLNKKKYITEANTYFLLRYLTSERPISKKLPIMDDTLLVINKNITEIKDSAIVELIYSHHRNDLICRFRLIFLDSENVNVIKNELVKIVSVLEQLNKPEEGIYKIVYDYLIEFYGNFNSYDLRVFLHDSLNLKNIDR